MKHHPYSELFPLLDMAELQAIADDIREHGLREPVVLLDGMILDGRNRYAACELAGVEPTFTTYSGDDPLGYVWSRNFHRRHLTVSQRGMAAARLANLSKGEKKADRQICLSPEDEASEAPESAPTEPENPPITQAEAAEKMKVSPRTARTAAKVLKDGTPEQIDAVDKGKKTVSAAAEEIKAKAKPKKPEREKITRTTKGDPLKDAAGIDVPDNLRDLFGDPWLEEAAQALEDANKALLACYRAAKNNRSNIFLCGGEIMKALEAARKDVECAISNFRSAKPTFLCKRCSAKGKVDGADCKDCRRSGWLPKWRRIELDGDKP